MNKELLWAFTKSHVTVHRLAPNLFWVAAKDCTACELFRLAEKEAESFPADTPKADEEIRDILKRMEGHLEKLLR